MSQTELLYNLLKDGQEHSTVEIMEKVYGGSHLGLARVSARIYDIKKKYGVFISGRTDTTNSNIYWYKIVKKRIDILDSINEETRRMEELKEITFNQGKLL